VSARTEHAQAARSNPEQRAGANHGKPAIAATARPGDFKQEHGAVGAKEPTEPLSGAGTEKRAPVHPNDLSSIARPAPVNSMNARADKKYEQQQDQLIARQNQQRQVLQRKQDSEHQQLTQ
jgi:hypothetical protein